MVCKLTCEFLLCQGFILLFGDIALKEWPRRARKVSVPRGNSPFWTLPGQPVTYWQSEVRAELPRVTLNVKPWTKKSEVWSAVAISCHWKVFLPSKSIFKQQEQTSTLPPHTGETAARKQTCCGRARQNQARERSPDGNEVQRHIPLGPERLLGSTPDPRDQSLLAKGTYISTGTACWMATAGEGRCCPNWAMVQVVPYPTVRFWPQPPCHGAGHGDQPGPSATTSALPWLSPAVSQTYRPSGQQQETASRERDDGAMRRKNGAAGGVEGGCGGWPASCKPRAPTRPPRGAPCEAQSDKPGEGSAERRLLPPGGGGHRCCRAGRGEARVGGGGGHPSGRRLLPDRKSVV